VQGALSSGPCAVDRDLKALELFVRHAFRRSDFERGATAKTPGGLDDFAGKGLFERSEGREFGHVAGFELRKDVLFFRADEVDDGEQTEFGCILRDAGFTCGRDGAGGLFGIQPIGQDPGGAGHVGVSGKRIPRGVKRFA
jgi:hypothetical protein